MQGLIVSTVCFIIQYTIRPWQIPQDWSAKSQKQHLTQSCLSFCHCGVEFSFQEFAAVSTQVVAWLHSLKILLRNSFDFSNSYCNLYCTHVSMWVRFLCVNISVYLCIYLSSIYIFLLLKIFSFYHSAHVGNNCQKLKQIKKLYLV